MVRLTDRHVTHASDAQSGKHINTRADRTQWGQQGSHRVPNTEPNRPTSLREQSGVNIKIQLVQTWYAWCTHYISDTVKTIMHNSNIIPVSTLVQSPIANDFFLASEWFPQVLVWISQLNFSTIFFQCLLSLLPYLNLPKVVVGWKYLMSR